MKTNSVGHSLINRIAVAGLAAIIAIGCYFNMPPPRRALAFEAQSTWGGTGGGTANAQTIALANVRSLNDLLGVPIRYFPSVDNTDQATISVNGLAVTAVYRPSSIGLVQLSGGELQTNVSTELMYNGFVFEIRGPVDMTPIGKTVEFRGSTAPRGTLIEDGSCVSTTKYAPLFTVIGTTYGSCSAGLFKLPFSNGTAFVAYDSQGVNGAANRITTACGSPNSPVVCGVDHATLTASLIPTITATNSGITLTNGSPAVSVNTGSPACCASGGIQGSVGASGTPVGSASVATNVTVSNQGGSTSNNTGGTSVSHPVENPILPGIRAIKF